MEGFILVGGQLKKYTKSGRQRKNWKTYYRQKCRRYLKKKCELCGSKENLTIHHKIPLSRGIDTSKENCQTLCEDCHKDVHGSIKKKFKKINKKYQSGTKKQHKNDR